MDQLTVTIDGETIVLQPEWIEQEYQVTGDGDTKVIPFIDVWNWHRWTVKWLGLAQSVTKDGVTVSVYKPSVEETIWAYSPKVFDR
jgi:hypothetical protein